jgi:recombinational DNA repair ATPase RecF
MARGVARSPRECRWSGLIETTSRSSSTGCRLRPSAPAPTLSLRLAEARLQERDLTDPPVLLLDDIVSELDERRRRSVLASIADFDQVWFTATDTHGFDTGFLDAAALFRVEAGTLRQ